MSALARAFSLLRSRPKVLWPTVAIVGVLAVLSAASIGRSVVQARSHRGSSVSAPRRATSSEIPAAPNPQSRSSVVTASPTSLSLDTSTTIPARQDLQIADYGFSSFKAEYGNTDYLSYGVILRNPNPSDWLASRVNVNITFFGASGTVVKSESDYVSALLPGQAAGLGDSLIDVSGASRMEVQALVQHWEQLPQAATSSFSVENVSTKVREYGGLQTTASVRSTFAKDLKQLRATAVYYDASGKIIGGAFTFVDFVPSGGSVGIEVLSTDTIPRVAKTDVFMNLPNLWLY